MALNEKGKNRLRRVIRSTMIAVAVFLLLIALAIPVVNNAVALGIERELKETTLPAQTELVESISVAGRYTGKGMQYFGAVLIKSELSLEEIASHYPDYEVEYQLTAAIRVLGKTVDGEDRQTFNAALDGTDYYVVYKWGSVPAWLKGILDMDAR